MSVVIRLRREGNRNNPHYRIVVADKRSPRDGKFLEQLGTYNPRGKANPHKFNLDADLAKKWISQGAQPSETVASMLRKLSSGKASAPKVKKKKPAKTEA